MVCIHQLLGPGLLGKLCGTNRFWSFRSAGDLARVTGFDVFLNLDVHVEPHNLNVPTRGQ